VAVKTEALSIFALLLSAPGGFLPLDKDLSWMTQGDHHPRSRDQRPIRRVAERARPKINHRHFPGVLRNEVGKKGSHWRGGVGLRNEVVLVGCGGFESAGSGVSGLDFLGAWAELLFGRSRGGLLRGFKDLRFGQGAGRGRPALLRSYAAWGWEVSVLEEPDEGVQRGSGDPAPLATAMDSVDGGSTSTMLSAVGLG
jgi:hypothetical protein